MAELGLTLAEAKRLTAALQAEVVPAQMAALSGRPRACEACGRRLAAKSHYGATFRSLFGEVPVGVRRWFVCPCRSGASEAKSVAALDFGGDAVAPELSYVTARYAAMAPFGKVAVLLSELLPIGGVRHASTVRNRTLRVGAEVVQAANAAETVNKPAAAADPVVTGLDGGHVRNRQRAEERRFEVIAGKVPWVRAPHTAAVTSVALRYGLPLRVPRRFCLPALSHCGTATPNLGRCPNERRRPQSGDSHRRESVHPVE